MMSFLKEKEFMPNTIIFSSDNISDVIKVHIS